MSTYRSCWSWSVSQFSTCVTLLLHGCQRNSFWNCQTDSQMYTFSDQINWQFVQILMGSKGAIHSTKLTGNFGPKLNGSVWSNRKSFEKTGPPFEVVLFSRSDRLEFWLNGSCPKIPLKVRVLDTDDLKQKTSLFSVQGKSAWYCFKAVVLLFYVICVRYTTLRS